jgi:hypothetical protein
MDIDADVGVEVGVDVGRGRLRGEGHGGERVNVNVNIYIIVFTDICTEKDPYMNIDMDTGMEDFWIGEFGFNFRRSSGIAFELNS